jgi:GMP synthase (glutamine-hydrolysing)
MSVRIALLNAARGGDPNRRNFRRELDANLVEFNVNERELPETFAFDGCVVTGSRASVYWDEPWIDDLRSWVRDAIDSGLPCLGVCFGHQLLADALGGQVDPMGEYEIGYRTVEHDGENQLLSGVNESFTVFTTHSDHVTELPPGATQFAENDYGIHGFRKGNVFTVQFHPEYDIETAETIVDEKDLPEERLERVHEGITEENYRAACDAKQLFNNFTEYIRTQQRAERAVAASDD